MQTYSLTRKGEVFSVEVVEHCFYQTVYDSANRAVGTITRPRRFNSNGLWTVAHLTGREVQGMRGGFIGPRTALAALVSEIAGA